MTTADAFTLTALDKAFYDDPYPVFRELRERDRMHREADGSYFVARYDDVDMVLGDHARFLSDKRIDFKPKFGDTPLYEHHTMSLVFNDPPYHTRVRRLLAPFFTPRTLKAMETTVANVIDELVDDAAEKGEIDIVNDFALAIPLALIGEMLGVPKDEREPLKNWAQIILGALEPALTPRQREVGNKAVEDFKAYLDGLIAAKKKRLAERAETDILSALIADQAKPDGLTDLEIVHNCIFMLNAGHDTTGMLISNGVDLLLRFPDQQARLRADPSLMKTAIEEMLRYESPLQLGNRRAAVDVTVQGEDFPAGTFFHVGIGSADHDERQFPDPEAFDIGRRPNRHLAFGTGIHTCAGNSLARMEATLAFSKLLDRFGKIERAGPIERSPRARFRVVSKLPVRLTA